MKKVSIAVQKKNRRDLIGVDGYVLLPVQEDGKKLNPFLENQILHVTVNGEVDPRNLEQLRLYWVCCQKVADNSDFPTKKDVDEYIKKKCHYVEWFVRLDGTEEARTRSISFENMDQPDFNKFMDDAIPAMAEVINVSPEALVKAQFDI